MKITRKMIYRRLLFIASIYMTVVLLMFIFQRSLLYLPSKNYKSPEAVGLQNIEEVFLKTEDGLELVSWYKQANSGAKTIIYFHGNAGSISRRSHLFKKIINRGYGLLALEYRGYGGNPGSPSEEGLYSDARAAMEYLRNVRNVDESDIILFGRSLGSGVAVQMATEYEVDSVVLVSPYDSIADVAQNLYWYLPAKYLMKDRFDSASKAHKITEPVYIFHGALDKIVPIANGRILFSQIESKKEFIEMKEEGHNYLDFNVILNGLPKE